MTLLSFVSLLFLLVILMTATTTRASIIQGDLEISSLCPRDTGPFNVSATGWSATGTDEILYYSFSCNVVLPTYYRRGNTLTGAPPAGYSTQSYIVFATTEVNRIECSVSVLSSNSTEDEEPKRAQHSLNYLQRPYDMQDFQCMFDQFPIVPSSQHSGHMYFISESLSYPSDLAPGEREQLVGRVLSEFESNINLTPDDVAKSMYTLSGMDDMSADTYTGMIIALTRALTSNDITEIYYAKTAAENLCEWFVSPDMTMVQKLALDALVSALMIKLREPLEIGDSARFYSSQYRVIVRREIPDPSDSEMWFDFNPARTVRSIDENRVRVIVDRKNLASIADPSIYAQVSAIAYPINSYEKKCDSEMVSPTVSVQLFSLSQNEIVLPPVVNSPLFNSQITPSELLNSTSYTYACRFFDSKKNTWRKDQQVCQTQIGEVYDESDPPEVTCSCIQPAQVGVSLDYVQSSSESESSGSKCDNPCGCKSKKNGWAPWKTALLVLGLLTIVLIIAALITIVAIVVVMRLSKGTEVQ